MDTRVSLFLLLDYQNFYGEEKTINDAVDLIREIPSLTLINYGSGFNVSLYLHENDDEMGKIQFRLVNSLLGKCDLQMQSKWRDVVIRESKNGFSPIMFYNYSNLLLYNIIFENYNNQPTRDLTTDEALKVFDAYLIVNTIVNNKYSTDTNEMQSIIKNGNIEDVTITNFIYQRDYLSTLDFRNQINRGKELFEFLEKDGFYKSYICEYYQSKYVTGWQVMFNALFCIIAKLGIDKEQRCQMVDLTTEISCGILNERYLETLSINTNIVNYHSDNSFKMLREKPLYKYDNYRYFVLDINFLFDLFYKNQVFAFSAFLLQKGVKNDFLSYKGKVFTEENYLPKIINKCFPNYIRYYNSDCLDSNGDELCDVYIREDNKICLIECKDVLLKADIKNSGDRKKLFDEFDKKFIKNEKGKQKGISQLQKAIIDINKNGIVFDKIMPNVTLDIYPIIIYTDNSFGIEGLNKYYRTIFEQRIRSEKLSVKVHAITFINLSYFEMHYEFYSDNCLNIWNMINGYNEYVNNSKYELTPFEIYSRWYMNMYVPEKNCIDNSF